LKFIYKFVFRARCCCNKKKKKNHDQLCQSPLIMINLSIIKAGFTIELMCA
jgi:hypothetical protein